MKARGLSNLARVAAPAGKRCASSVVIKKASQRKFTCERAG